MEMANAEFHKVQVTHVVDPQSFYARLGTAESFLAFDEYEAKLQSECVGTKTVENLSEIYEGQNLLAKSIETGKWHRAKVQDITMDHEVEVDFIDYGYSEYVTKDKLIYMNGYEHTFNPMAFQCTMSHIKPSTPDWLDKAIVRFEEIVLNKILDVQIEYADPPGGQIIILDILVDDGETVKTVTDILMDERLAEPLSDLSNLPSPLTTMEQTRQDMSIKSDSVLDKMGHKKVPEFNLKSLQKRTSDTGKKRSKPEKIDDDIEVKLLSKGLDTESTFEWAKSDLTIGSAYKPNIAHDVIGSIQDQIKQMNDARTNLPDTFSKPEPKRNLSSPVFHDDEVRKGSKLQSPRVRQLQEGQHVYRSRKKQANTRQQQDVTSSDEEKKESRIPVARHKSYIKTKKDVGKLCSDAGKLLGLLDKDVEFHSEGSRDSSPISTDGPASAHSSIVGSSDNSPRAMPPAAILHSKYGESQDSFFHQKPPDGDTSSGSVSAASSHATFTKSQTSSREGLPKPPRRGASFDNEPQFAQFRDAVGDVSNIKPIGAEVSIASASCANSNATFTKSQSLLSPPNEEIPRSPRRGANFDNEPQFVHLRKAVKDTLKNMHDTDLASCVQILKTLIEDNLATVPHAKRVYTCFDLILDYAITSNDQHIDQCIKLFDGLHDIPEATDTISRLLWKYQNDYVRVSSMVSVKKKCLAYCKFLGKLYCCAVLKWEDGHESIPVCTKNTIDKWTCHEKWGLASMPEDLWILYAQCLKELFNVAGGVMENQKPSFMDTTFHDIHTLVVESRLPRNVKYAYLELIELRGKKWPMSDEIEIPEVVKVDVPVQTDVNRTKVEKYISYAEQWQKHITETEKENISDLDMYQDVKLMLKSLQMIDLQSTFLDNCIRDTTLDLDFDELREVLTDCGLKPGHILEIKSYLRKRAIKKSRQKADGRKATPPSTSKKIVSHDHGEHTHSVETQTEKTKLSPKKELQENNQTMEVPLKNKTPKKDIVLHRENSPRRGMSPRRNGEKSNEEKERGFKDKAKSESHFVPNESPTTGRNTRNINPSTIKSLVTDWIAGDAVQPVVVPKLDLSEKSRSEVIIKQNVAKKTDKAKNPKASSKPQSPSSARNYSNNNNSSNNRPYSSARNDNVPDSQSDEESPAFGSQRWARLDSGSRKCTACGSDDHVIYACPDRRKNFFHN